MLIDDSCSIYEHRPHTCRTYDCRVFAAAGIDAGDNKTLITKRAKRWKFSYREDDRIIHTAVKAAAKFLREDASLFPSGFVPLNATQLAILAIKVHDVFLPDDRRDKILQVPLSDITAMIVSAKEKFGSD
jgi:hypothetical protein